MSQVLLGLVLGLLIGVYVGAWAYERFMTRPPESDEGAAK